MSDTAKAIQFCTLPEIATLRIEIIEDEDFDDFYPWAHLDIATPNGPEFLGSIVTVSGPLLGKSTADDLIDFAAETLATCRFVGYLREKLGESVELLAKEIHLRKPEISCRMLAGPGDPLGVVNAARFLRQRSRVPVRVWKERDSIFGPRGYVPVHRAEVCAKLASTRPVSSGPLLFATEYAANRFAELSLAPEHVRRDDFEAARWLENQRGPK